MDITSKTEWSMDEAHPMCSNIHQDAFFHMGIWITSHSCVTFLDTFTVLPRYSKLESNLVVLIYKASNKLVILVR